MILSKNTGSINATEILMLLNDSFPVNAFTFEDIFYIEKICVRFKQGFLLGVTKSYCKWHNIFNIENFYKTIEGSVNGVGDFNDVNYMIDFNPVNPIFYEILNFVCVGYSRDDFLLLENTVDIFDSEIIRSAIKEQDENWNYPKLLFKKCSEIKIEKDDSIRRAKLMEERIKKQTKHIDKQIDVLGALQKMEEWDSKTEEDDLWDMI